MFMSGCQILAYRDTRNWISNKPVRIRGLRIWPGSLPLAQPSQTHFQLYNFPRLREYSVTVLLALRRAVSLISHHHIKVDLVTIHSLSSFSLLHITSQVLSIIPQKKKKISSLSCFISAASISFLDYYNSLILNLSSVKEQCHFHTVKIK